MISSLRVSDEATHRSSVGQGGGTSPSGSTPMTVPSGTVLMVSFEQTLSSANSQSGERFTARVVEPVLLNGRVAIAASSWLPGRNY
jgi:hypothetical protein